MQRVPGTWQRVPRTERVVVDAHGKQAQFVTFLGPDEKEEEFLLFGWRDGSVILPLTRERNVIVVTQYKQGCDKEIRGLPGGFIDPGEDPFEAASRELLEETGYEPGTLLGLGLERPIWVSPRHSWTRFFPFLAIGCTQIKEPEADPSEQIRVELIPLREWIDMVQAEIEDPFAALTTLRALPLLRGLNLL